MEPYEVIVSPFRIYLAPVGESFPAINATPAGNWVELGNNRELQGEDGVTINHPQSFFVHRGQATGQKKVARTEEDLTIAFTLHDMRLEAYNKAVNNNTVTDTPAGSGVAGYRSIPVLRGHAVTTHAMLVRGGNASSYGGSWNRQMQIPIVYQSGSPAPVFTKSGAAGLALEFTAIEDDTLGLGTIVDQDADPT